MPKANIQLGTTNPGTGIIGCWSNLDHHINGRPAVEFRCTVCSHAVEAVGVTDASIKSCMVKMRQECPNKSKVTYSRVPQPEKHTIAAVDQYLVDMDHKFMKQSKGNYRVSLGRAMMFVLLSVFNPDQNCWRFMKKGRPVLTKWGTIEELFTFLEQARDGDFDGKE